MESDIISGDPNKVTLPCTYNGKISEKIIKGNSTTSEFFLNWTRNVPGIITGTNQINQKKTQRILGKFFV